MIPVSALVLTIGICVAIVIILSSQLKHANKQKKILEHQLPMLAQEMFQTFKSGQLEAEMKILREEATKQAELRFINWKAQFEIEVRRDAIKRSGAVIMGNAFEQFAPWFSTFPFDPSAFRNIGSPVDMIGFLDDRIVFLEMKSGNSRLSEKQKQIKQLVLNKKVEWLEYRLNN